MTRLFLYSPTVFSEIFPDLFVKSLSILETGNVTRQEAVFMIPTVLEEFFLIYLLFLFLLQRLVT